MVAHFLFHKRQQYFLKLSAIAGEFLRRELPLGSSAANKDNQVEQHPGGRRETRLIIGLPHCENTILLIFANRPHFPPRSETRYATTSSNSSLVKVSA